MFEEAIIIAGGKGTRLSSVLSDRPKPMAPIHEVPFLTILLNYLQMFGIKKVVLSVGYMHEKITEHYGDQHENVVLEYSFEDQPLGTGGAIKKALSKCNSNHILVMNGDSFFEVKLHQFYKHFLSYESVAQLALKEMDDISRFGSVSIDENRMISNFNEKGKTGKGLINGGVYALDRNKILPFLEADAFSFEYDFLNKMAGELPISTVTSKGTFIDIGTPESYQKALEIFK